MSAIERSVRVLYGERSSKIPPFIIPGPPPQKPKDPLQDLKSKKKKKKKKRSSGLNKVSEDNVGHFSGKDGAELASTSSAQVPELAATGLPTTSGELLKFVGSSVAAAGPSSVDGIGTETQDASCAEQKMEQASLPVVDEEARGDSGKSVSESGEAVMADVEEISSEGTVSDD